MSFDIFVVTYRVTNFLPKLHILLNFHFLNSLFRVLPYKCAEPGCCMRPCLRAEESSAGGALHEGDRLAVVRDVGDEHLAVVVWGLGQPALLQGHPPPAVF